MGANLIADGATFRAWAPRATAVYLNGRFGGRDAWTKDPDLLLLKDSGGYWTGFLEAVSDGDIYSFYVEGVGSSGYKRDPYARELTANPPFPNSNCIVRSPASYPWHDGDFHMPAFADLVIYQLHIGTYALSTANAPSTFLDVIDKLEHLTSLGVNVLQPLPIDEMETNPSLGYNGGDYFSPDLPYVVVDPNVLESHFERINGLLAAKARTPLANIDTIRSGPNQLKALVDCCHLCGIAVTFDVVYNHAGGFFGDDHALYFWDRFSNGNLNNSLYFTDQGWAGGLSFALWNRDVRQFVINSAKFYLAEFHVDGFRYDEISVLNRLNVNTGWSFCQDLTNTVRFLNPRALQNAEYWPVNPAIVASSEDGGAGFDVTQHDGLRDSVRAAIDAASFGEQATLDIDAIAAHMYPVGFASQWKAVTCIENHDIVKEGTGLRIPTLADKSDQESWYARSRARAATGLLLTAPGIPMLFMGQEILESKQWSDDPKSPLHIDWSTLDKEASKTDFLHFASDIVHLRSEYPALRAQNVNVFHVHNENRVMAFHRWISGIGADVVVVWSLCDTTYHEYDLGFPQPDHWFEVFNSDAYDHCPNPVVAGNGGSTNASGPPLHGFSQSSSITIPANAILVFATHRGD